MKYQELTRKTIGCFYQVYNALGYGFLETIYQNAMIIELARAGIQTECQYPVNIVYGDNIIGQFFLDIVVENVIIVELKAVQTLLAQHEAQLTNYLNATEFEVGLLLNFGPLAQIRRKVYDNENKKYYLYRHQNSTSVKSV